MKILGPFLSSLVFVVWGLTGELWCNPEPLTRIPFLAIGIVLAIILFLVQVLTNYIPTREKEPTDG